MIRLQNYLQPIKVADRWLGYKYYAYRMDSVSPAPFMRGDAGLGTCSCCDYFITDQNSVYLIEETQLSKSIDQLKTRFSYLNEDDQLTHIRKLIRQEIRLKIFGANLVLCRLNALSNEARDKIQQKRFIFWLVVCELFSNDDLMFLDNLQSDLHSDLRSQLSKKTLEKVEIVSSNALAEKMSKFNLDILGRVDSNLETINRFLQERLAFESTDEITENLAIKWLNDAGILADSATERGSPLRRLLRANKIIGQIKRPEKPGGKWFIRRIEA